MRTLSFSLPWPPSVNHYYCHAKNGSVFLGKRGREYRGLARLAFSRLGWPRIETAVRVDLVASPPDRRKRDIDNIRKAVYDAISDRKNRGVVVHRGILPDDEAIREDSAVFTDPGESLVHITITELETNQWNNKPRKTHR